MGSAGKFSAQDGDVDSRLRTNDRIKESIPASAEERHSHYREMLVRSIPQNAPRIEKKCSGGGRLTTNRPPVPCMQG